jgi:HemX protein
MNHAPLIASTLCFLLGFAYVLFALGARAYRASRFQFVVMAAGFALQTLFLYQRGKVIGRCPLTNLFEVLVFLSWAMVLFYLVIGPSYRLSLLGAFTAPLAFGLQTVALISGLDSISAKMPVNAYLEFHAAFSVLAYGAFVLAGLAGGMYLLQDWQLKTHRLNAAFFELPPIHSLGVANSRLIAVGFVLLTIGMLAGFGIGRSTTSFKLGWSIGVWLLYGGIVAAQWIRHLAPRRVANLSVFASCLAITTLWGITFISDPEVGNKGNSKLEIRNSKELHEARNSKLESLNPNCASPRGWMILGISEVQVRSSFLRISNFEFRVCKGARAPLLL